MFKSRFMKAGALGALVTALLATSLPAQAQDRRDGRGQRAERAQSNNWGGRSEQRSERRAQRAERQEQRAERRAERAVPPPAARNYGGERDRSYGAYARRGDAGVERQARDAQARMQQPQRREWRQEQRAERREDARESRRDYRQGYRAGQREEWRDDRRDDRRDARQAYNRGYRAGDRDDNRWGQRDHRRWDNRGWRNDNRYDWYRYRAANRNVYRLGRYYSPYNNYRYSRINIGFRLGSLFYSNRYWINDPWQYRLPEAYGPYRWVRYYDDALLVDIYSGQVVDVIHDFFW